MSTSKINWWKFYESMNSIEKFSIVSMHTFSQTLAKQNFSQSSPKRNFFFFFFLLRELYNQKHLEHEANGFCIRKQIWKLLQPNERVIKKSKNYFLNYF